MKAISTLAIALLSCLLFAQDDGLDLTIMDHHDGFIPYYHDTENDKIYFEIQNPDSELLYHVSLATGIGSNDIGLDRGRLGNSRVVSFRKAGNKLLLTEVNYGFRANSDNALEVEAVKEAFAESVLWGFKIEEERNGGYLIDATSFILRDAYQAAEGLSMRKQGSYKMDASRSALYLPHIKNFPDNSEIEATITLTGKPTGREVRSVTPDASAVTVRQHHSFVRLPDDDYQPRMSDPRSGYITESFYDFATPIAQPLVKKYIRRHRLEKKDPTAEISEPVEPIVYYLDPGTPEPIRSALLEGASWWNQAYEAAGYKDAFIVKMLPDDADPMDIRYNLIQWVHRSTRGWSYGSSVVDPRTGEIIKGKVTLGSLRVRQDYLIAQGLLAAFEDGRAADGPLVAMSLARLRQLSAHEVGHTIGLVHNYISSADDRASVMDYPHPYVEMENDIASFDRAYDDKIGAWDKRAIIYGYQDFPEGTDESAELQKILNETNAMGLRFLSDQDGRPASSAHPLTHLWDNGSSPVAELMRMSDVRRKALNQFGEDNVPDGTPLSYLEEVFVPLYFSHRYQVEGVTKVIGGLDYRYSVKGEADTETKIVSVADQESALDACLHTLSPSFLEIPESVIRLIPPRAMGERRSSELLKNMTGLTFDPLSAAKASANFTLDFLLNPARLNRVLEHHSRDGSHMSIGDLLSRIESDLTRNSQSQGMQGLIGESVQFLFMQKLMEIARDEGAQHQVQGAALAILEKTKNQSTSSDHQRAMNHEIGLFMSDPENYSMQEVPELPAGSPIGCGGN